MISVVDAPLNPNKETNKRCETRSVGPWSSVIEAVRRCQWSCEPRSKELLGQNSRALPVELRSSVRGAVKVVSGAAKLARLSRKARLAEPIISVGGTMKLGLWNYEARPVKL